MPPKNFDYDPMNDVLFKFIFGSEERKQITIDCPPPHIRDFSRELGGIFFVKIILRT